MVHSEYEGKIEIIISRAALEKLADFINLRSLETLGQIIFKDALFKFISKIMRMDCVKICLKIVGGSSSSKRLINLQCGG